MTERIIITEINFLPLKPNDKGLIGIASIVFNNSFSLNCIAVYTRPDGSDYRLLFPVKTLPNGKEINIYYPINRQTYEAIKQAVVKKIEELAEKMDKRYAQEKI